MAWPTCSPGTSTQVTSSSTRAGGSDDFQGVRAECLAPSQSRSSYAPLRYSINATLDGCCDHRAIIADEALHRPAAENIASADALLFGRVTYEMMEAGIVSRLELGSGAVALRYEPIRNQPQWTDHR